MVSLHTSWDAFSFISVSLVSVRASYSRTGGQVRHTETTGYILPQQAWWCWALHRPGRPSQGWPQWANFHPCSGSFVPSVAYQEFPSHRALNILSSSRPCCPLVLYSHEHVDTWTSYLTLHSRVFTPGFTSHLYLTLCAHFWCLNVIFQSFWSSLKLMFLAEPRSLACSRNRPAFKIKVTTTTKTLYRAHVPWSNHSIRIDAKEFLP